MVPPSRLHWEQQDLAAAHPQLHGMTKWQVAAAEAITGHCISIIRLNRRSSQLSCCTKNSTYQISVLERLSIRFHMVSYVFYIEVLHRAFASQGFG
jgi:hypothetical protein